MIDPNAKYVDELGKEIAPENIGKTHEIDQDQSKTKAKGQPDIYGQQVQEQRVSNFISQTSPSQSLQSINYILQGFIFDNQQEKWVKLSQGIPDDIRLDFLQFITPDLSEDVRMTNLSSEQINGIMSFIIEWVTDYLDIKADEKGSTLTEEQMTKIGLIIIKACYYTILRAQNGIERKHMFNSLKMGENLSPESMPQQGKQAWYKFWK